MSDLVIHMKKKTDGCAALSCRRADGSVTWQRHRGRQAAFFPLHDLTHYAVEAELPGLQGFYHLLAQGWNLDDFGAPWPRGPLPPDAAIVELLVGFLDQERAAGVEWPAAELNDAANRYCEQHQVRGGRAITDDAWRRIRARRRELFAQWAALPAGETLELRLVATAAPTPP